MKRYVIVGLLLLLSPALAGASWFTDCRDARPLGETCTQANIGINACCDRKYRASNPRDTASYFSCTHDNAVAFVDCNPSSLRGVALTPEQREAIIFALVAQEFQRHSVAQLLGTEPEETDTKPQQ